MSTILNRRALVGSAIALGAFCAVNPTQALGVTAAQKQAEVRAVKSQLEAMAGDVSAAGDRYHQAMDAYSDATARVEEAQATIAEMSERIVSLQDRLDVRATAMYRSGSTSYLDVLLGVSTFEDFATVWDTLNTLNAEDADLVASTKITKSTLESAQSELVEQQQRAAEQLSSAEAYMNQVLAKQDEYDRIYNNLSSEYRQILAEQEAAEAQASARAPQEFVPSPVEVTPPATSNSSGSGGSNGGGSSSSGGSSSITETPSGGGEAPSLPTNSTTRIRRSGIRTCGAERALTSSIARALWRGAIARSAFRCRPIPNPSTHARRRASAQVRPSPVTCSTSPATWGYPPVGSAASRRWERAGASSRAVEEAGPPPCVSKPLTGDYAVHCVYMHEMCAVYGGLRSWGSMPPCLLQLLSTNQAPHALRALGIFFSCTYITASRSWASR